MSVPKSSLTSIVSPIVSLGRVQRPKGLHGQMRITTRGELLSQVPAGASISVFRADKIFDGFLLHPELHSHLILQKIESVFPDYVVLSAQGFSSIEDVEKIKGLFLGFDSQDIPSWLPLEEELYLFEYIGLTVRDQHGKVYGKIIRVEDNASSPLLIITTDVEQKNRNNKGKEVLIPLYAPYVKKPLRGNSFLEIEDFAHFL